MKLSKKGLEKSCISQKKIILVTLLVFSLFLLVACDGEEVQTTGGAYLGGTQGIVAEFEQFGVENSIYETETFPLEVIMRNKGEYELQPGEVTVELKGPSLDFSGIPNLELQNTGIIDIISELLTTGGEETLTFSADAKYDQEVNGIIEREWFANIEYKYQTYLIITEVCLKEDLTDDRVCDVKASKDYSVSGAPVTVTSVEEDTAGQGIMALKIQISNVGGGDVTKIGEEFGTYDRLAFSIDDAGWECKSGGKINEARFIDGNAEVVCKLKDALAEDTLATKQLKLTFDYTYRDLIQSPLKILESS
ncbi:MAG: hypothetical protein KJ597_03560 [Nanoarchaeota archaeon]|nr:hypothetical protein [Nanoarchaeota archaeon]